ncbi:ribonuclease III [Candidatus Roizmanbacteria bacterium]|nr:ribonuclease III [Candidatus Roizmanbacteria bacterium]
MKNLKDLETKIGLHFKNRALLENAFIHRSYLNENKHFYLPSNEKLEFLGDSVLSLITSSYLYKHYPSLREGDYTEIKAAVVRTESLSEAAKSLRLGKYLYLSKGQDLEKGRENQNILADCFEALIGAIFLDFGFQKAYRFVLQYLYDGRLEVIIKNNLYLSPKSRLQEYSQSVYKGTPRYQVLEEIGPEHLRIFKVAVYINNKLSGTASGKSKKEAEELAAKKALEKLT